MMKTTHKLILVLLVLALTLSLAVPLFATDGDPDQGNGKITITNAVPGQTYSVYRIFDLQSYNKDEKAYLYTVNPAWQGFIAQNGIKGTYVDVNDTTGLVTWKMKNGNDDTGMAEFAEQALAYAKVHSIPETGSQKAGAAEEGKTTTTVTITGLPLGYYLVDSSLGALCALDTTDNEVTMAEKNGAPTVDKEVLEGNSFGDEASAQIGDTVSFQTTITVNAGAENYVLHDKMSDGLEFVSNSVKVYLNPQVDEITGKISADFTPIDATSNYEVETTNLEDSTPCSFHVVFSADFCKRPAKDNKIVVTYDAILTGDAFVKDNGTSSNETQLQYGDNTKTTEDSVDVHTYQFQLVKTDEGKNDTYNVLSGAKFKLYDAETNGNVISFVKDGQNYRVATSEEISGTTVATVDEIDAGTPIIKGLDEKMYWLEETEAPEGFNKVTGRTGVDLSTGDNIVSVTDWEGKTYTTGNGGVQVINKAGSKLPSTGGIGTTIFYVLGGILVIGAGILLAIRLRRPSEEK